MTVLKEKPSKISKKRRMQARLAADRAKSFHQPKLHPFNTGFHCLHCGYFISTLEKVSGVQNRNHCPYCLHSRHLDLHHAGDRLSACKAVMKPIGLTYKPRRNPYAPDSVGELALVHLCTRCAKLSINRIAADDDVQTILAVLEETTSLDVNLKRRLEREHLRLLGAEDITSIQRALLGKDQRT